MRCASSVTRPTLMPRWLAIRVRTSLAAKTALKAVVWSLDAKPPMVMIAPNSLNTPAMRPSNPPRNVALCKSLESVAVAPQLLDQILPGGAVDGGQCASLIGGLAARQHLQSPRRR